jgi:type II secretory ATPase GspE/PulE/Tfp pilus assembly ATPase PilB-like protein
VRLRDLGVEDFIIASTIRGVISQRLLRLLCPHCKKPSTRDIAWNGVAPDKIYEHTGCHLCRQTGYIGRSAIAEVLKLDKQLVTMIGERCTISEIEKAAKSSGMRPLTEAGIDLVAQGLTDIAEYERVL